MDFEIIQNRQTTTIIDNCQLFLYYIITVGCIQNIQYDKYLFIYFFYF